MWHIEYNEIQLTEQYLALTSKVEGDEPKGYSNQTGVLGGCQEIVGCSRDVAQ